MNRRVEIAIMDWYRDQSSRCIVKAGKDNDLSNIGGDDLVEGNIESAYVNRQVMNDVRRLLDMLPPIQREVVYMRYYQQLSFKEIADTTSVSINTALGRMRYALLNMRRMAKSNGISLQLA
jgi:RNA polymerase sigma-70 factor (ECF subfamily)